MVFGVDFTNGVFYVDNNVDCVIVSQTSAITNKLNAGKTYQMDGALVEFNTSLPTTFFFSGAPLLQVSSNSSFSIVAFDQEVENLTEMPRHAKFGTHLLNLSLTKGEFCIVYPNINTNSRININTHYSDYELNGGKYYFRLTGKSALVYVLDGGMVIHGDKNKMDSVAKGNLALAIPFLDTDSGVDDKFMTSFKKAKPDEMERFKTPVLFAEKKLSDVEFFVIGGKVIGFYVK